MTKFLTAIFTLFSTWLLIIISLSIGRGSTKGSKPVQGASLTHTSYNNNNKMKHYCAKPSAYLPKHMYTLKCY